MPTDQEHAIAHTSVYPAKFVEFHGPATWKALHSIAFCFAPAPSPEEQRAAVDFFGALRHLLPCEFCREHYAKHLAEHPVDASSGEALARWVYDLHSAVNRRRHVADDLTFEQVREMYTGWSLPRRAELATLPQQTRLKRLADPHLGQRPQTHEDAVRRERAKGGGEEGPDSVRILLLVATGAIVAAAGTVYLRSREARRRVERA
jgi:hypothetical protein